MEDLPASSRLHHPDVGCRSKMQFCARLVPLPSAERPYAENVCSDTTDKQLWDLTSARTGPSTMGGGAILPPLPRVLARNAYRSWTMLPRQQPSPQVPPTPSPPRQTSTRRALDYPHPFKDTLTHRKRPVPAACWGRCVEWCVQGFQGLDGTAPPIRIGASPRPTRPAANSKGKRRQCEQWPEVSWSSL